MLLSNAVVVERGFDHMSFSDKPQNIRRHLLKDLFKGFLFTVMTCHVDLSAM